ncbi:MAG: hypothetical protein V1748_10050 [Actinomycetota bacterium]
MADENRFFIHQDELMLFAYLMSGSLVFADRIAREALAEVGEEAGHVEGTERVLLPGPATALCLDALSGGEPGGLPSRASVPGREHEAAEGFQRRIGSRLEPFPDDLVPETILGGCRYESRESVSLELAGALQALEPASRAVLILHDMLGIEEKYEAGMLRSQACADLDEARDTLARTYRQEQGRREPPPDEDATELIMKYIFSWETSDSRGLDAMFSKDVVLQSPSSDRWFEGRGAVTGYLEGGPLAPGTGGDRRLLPTRANGQLAFVVYRLDDSRKTYRATSIQVVYFDSLTVSEIVDFTCPSLFALFGLPDEVIAQGRTDG